MSTENVRQNTLNCTFDKKSGEYAPIPRLAPTWQYFGTITCDGLLGIMKLYIDKP